MALIIIRDLNELPNDMFDRILLLYSPEDVQMVFCDEIEDEIIMGKPFLTNPDVLEYLNIFGVRYKGNYLIESDDWGVMSSREKEQFVTYLNYPLQLACLVLHHEKRVIVMGDLLYDSKYLLPIIKKKDIYIKLESFEEVRMFMEVVSEGAELIIRGRSSMDYSEDEFEDYLEQLEKEANYLSREVDAKVFDASKIEVFTPKTMLLSEYISLIDESDKWIFDNLIEKNPQYRETIVMINGKSEFTGCFRKYPIHYLFYLEGEWRYVSDLSCKNPSFADVISEAALEPNPFDYKKQCTVDVTKATKIFSLILNCNEVCDVSRYWEHVCFLVKYDRETNVLEICDKNSALIEFHELLQASKDFE